MKHALALTLGLTPALFAVTVLRAQSLPLNASSLLGSQPDAAALANALRQLQQRTAPSGSLADTMSQLLQPMNPITELVFDTKGVEFGPWIRRFITQIRMNFFVRYATMASRGQVVTTFQVRRDGSVADATVAKSSSLDDLDSAALAALTSATPVPLPPEADTNARFTVTFMLNEPRATLPIWPPAGVFVAGTEGVVSPRVVYAEPVHYPDEAIRAHLEGSVLIEGIVQPDGSIAYVHIVRSLDTTFGLNLEALRAAARYRFAPGQHSGEPVPVVTTFEIAFSLQR